MFTRCFTQSGPRNVAPQNPAPPNRPVAYNNGIKLGGVSHFPRVCEWFNRAMGRPPAMAVVQVILANGGVRYFRAQDYEELPRLPPGARIVEERLPRQSALQCQIDYLQKRYVHKH
jgi:hypothetical protein